MGWRTLKCGYLSVQDDDTVFTFKAKARWVRILFDVYTKLMKVEVLKRKQSTVPQMSLVLKPNSVSIDFIGSDPRFIVCLKSKIVSKITLSYWSTDEWVDQTEILDWQIIFKSAINPSSMYGVVMLQSSTPQHGLILVTERNVQLSIANVPNRSVESDSNIISTDVDKVELTVEDTLLLSMGSRTVLLRTNRLIELYQHLMMFFTGRQNATGPFNIAHFDYINVRRSSRDVLKGIPSEEYSSRDEARNSVDGDYILPGRNYSTPQLRSPSPDVHRERVRSPQLLPPIMANKGNTPPEPPPKPDNAKEILHEFQNLEVSTVGEDPTYYRTVNKVDSGDSSIYADMESQKLPSTSSEYTAFQTKHVELDGNHGYTNVRPRSDYINLPWTVGQSIEPEAVSDASSEVPSRKTSSSSRPLRNSTIVPYICDENDVEDEIYDSLYTFQATANSLSDCDLSESVKSTGIYSVLARNGLTPPLSPRKEPPECFDTPRANEDETNSTAKLYTENLGSKFQYVEKKLSQRLSKDKLSVTSRDVQSGQSAWPESSTNLLAKKDKVRRIS